MELGKPGGGVDFLARPLELGNASGPEELGKVLGRARSSLVVVQNPCLDNKLGILMAETTTLDHGHKGFFKVYIIEADGTNYNFTMVDMYQMARIRVPDADTPHQVVSDRDTYPIGSMLPHEVCKITDDEFTKFESTLISGGNLDGLVNNMAELIGKFEFSYEDGKLVLPDKYASTRI